MIDQVKSAIWCPVIFNFIKDLFCGGSLRGAQVIDQVRVHCFSGDN